MKILLFVVFINVLIFSQSEQVSPSHPIYGILKNASVRGLISGYNDFFLPLSLNQINNYLKMLESNRLLLDPLELSEIERFKRWHGLEVTSSVASFDLLSEQENYLFDYNDSTISLKINPYISIGVNTGRLDKSDIEAAANISYGGTLQIAFGDNYYGYLHLSNGNAYGNRDVNKLQQNISQSFTFNETGLNHFDEARGGIFFEEGLFSIALAKQQIVSGNGVINKSLISGASQAFDYIGFGIDHKIFNFKMIHAWLSTPSYRVFSDSVGGFIKHRDQKFLAMNRIGFFPFGNLGIGVTQTVIYANRGFELGYLNPFMFYESSQRSLGDVDNSFLSFDISYIPVPEIQLTGNITFDDINFEFLNPEKISNISNRFSYQIGLLFNPSWHKRVDIALEYYFVRPYTYSHYGYGENLAYVNNSTALGVDLKPNSDMFSVRFNYSHFIGFRSRLAIRFIRHGENITSSTGEVIKNVGGSFFYSTNYRSTSVAPFLDGDYKYETRLEAGFTYEISYAMLLNFDYTWSHGNYNELFPDHYFHLDFQLYPF